MWSVMLCCVWKIKMFWQIPQGSEPRQPPQLITTVSNIVWNAVSFLGAEDTANTAPRYLIFSINFLIK